MPKQKSMKLIDIIEQTGWNFLPMDSLDAEVVAIITKALSCEVRHFDYKRRVSIRPRYARRRKTVDLPIQVYWVPELDVIYWANPLFLGKDGMSLSLLFPFSGRLYEFLAQYLKGLECSPTEAEKVRKDLQDWQRSIQARPAWSKQSPLIRLLCALRDRWSRRVPQTQGSLVLRKGIK